MTLTESRRFVEVVMRRALYVTEMKRERVAEILGVTEPHLAKQITGEEHLSLQRLAQIEDRVFWLIFLTEFKKHFQIIDTTAPEIAHALNLLITSIGKQVTGEEKQRMAKASLPDGVSERRRKIA